MTVQSRVETVQMALGAYCYCALICATATKSEYEKTQTDSGPFVARGNLIHLAGLGWAVEFE